MTDPQIALPVPADPTPGAGRVTTAGRPRDGEAAVGVGHRPRTWVVELPAGMPLLNANKRQHYMVKARLTRAIREAALVCANRDGVSNLHRAHVVCEYRPPDRRRRDVHNLYPSAKAAVDGLIDAGVLPDDSDAYLVGPDMRLGGVEKPGRLVLHITELEVA